MKNETALNLTVQEISGGSTAELGEVAEIRWTATGGLDLPETTTLGQLRAIMATFKRAGDHLTVAIADLFSYAKKQGWEREVEQMLLEFEFDVAQVRKSVAIGDVPRRRGGGLR